MKVVTEGKTWVNAGFSSGDLGRYILILLLKMIVQEPMQTETIPTFLGVYYKRERPNEAQVGEAVPAISSNYPLVPAKGQLRAPMVSESAILSRNGQTLPAQVVCARLSYNRPYVSQSVTDTIGGDGFYKHQVLVGRQMFQNDSCLVMHDPGTGKTVTQLYVMMELLKARVITRFVLINQSQHGNKVAMDTLERIYNRVYLSHFRMDFRHFAKQFVQRITLFEIGEITYESHTGIVVDEAHNLLSDNEPDTKKVEHVETFVEKLTKLEGIKLLLLSATPLLGDISSLGKFRQILYRNKQEKRQEIPPCLISYTQISYTHLSIVQRTNPAYSYDIGNRSFMMTNGVIYPFFLYVCKPSPMQIADFAVIAARNQRAPFQSKIKPLIVSSKTHKVMNGETETTQKQSAIADEILKLMDEATDGTIIIYCDLVDNGALAMALYLDQHGFVAYTKRDSSQRGSDPQGPRGPSPTRQLEHDFTDKHRTLKILKSELSKTTEESVNDLLIQGEDYEELSEKDSYTDVALSFLKYVNDSTQNHTKNEDLSQRIANLEQEIIELRTRIEELRPHKKGAQNGPRRYLLYLSDRSKDDTDAFKVFNSEDNWDGSLIKVIIGSRVMRDGVDIHHAVQTHIIIPDWRIPGYIQAQHRGIRSAGHDYLIHHRAIKKVEKSRADPDIPHDKKLTYKEARDQVINVDKVEVSIFNHFVDFRLLRLEDIETARVFLDEDTMLATMSNNQILLLLVSGDTKHKAGEAIIEAAIDSYRPVGAEMMKLRSSALDYQLNVRKDARVRDAMTSDERELQNHDYTRNEFFGVEDMELFFMTDSTDIIIKRITEMLLKHGYRNTDDIFEELMHDPDDKVLPPSKEMIATAIVELTQFRGRVYHEFLGLELYVKLYETETESILYLCTTRNEASADNGTPIHPYIAFTENIGYSTNKHIERVVTRIRQKDLGLVKGPTTFHQLQDVLKRAMEGAHIQSLDLQFLAQMSNYWGFTWHDLARIEDNRSEEIQELTSVYVLEGHIVRPDMNVLARNLTAYEYRTSTKQWHAMKTTSIKNTMLVRYGTLFKFYRDFSPFTSEHFKHYYSGESIEGRTDTNGIIMVKDKYHPIDPTAAISGTPEDYIENMFGNALSPSSYLGNKLGDKIIVKVFKKKDSRGSQIGNTLGERNDRSTIRNELVSIVRDTFTLPFFLYLKDKVVRDGYYNFIDIKLEELREMRLAIAGTPTLRFQIYAVETQIQDPEKKRKAYQAIYKPPKFPTRN